MNECTETLPPLEGGVLPKATGPRGGTDPGDVVGIAFKFVGAYSESTSDMFDVTVVGSCNFDQVVFVPTLPLPGQTIYGTKYISGFGGKGANQVSLPFFTHLAIRVSSFR